MIKEEFKGQSKKSFSNRPKRQQLFWIYKMIMNRKNFQYTFADGIKYYFWKIKNVRGCPCRSNKSFKELRMPKKDIQLKKARKRLMEELDIVRLVNTMRNFEETQRVLF